jgi:hypothetical protein
VPLADALSTGSGELELALPTSKEEPTGFVRIERRE